jgi:hypothetical protein
MSFLNELCKAYRAGASLDGDIESAVQAGDDSAVRSALAAAVSIIVDSTPEYPDLTDEAAADVEQVWSTWWAHLVAPDGYLLVDRVKRELADYARLQETMSKVVCEVTGNLLSKPTYTATTIIAEFNSYVEKLLAEQRGECDECGDKLSEPVPRRLCPECAEEARP